MHRVYSYITTYSSGIPSLVSETEPGTERNPNKVKSKHMGGAGARATSHTEQQIQTY